MGVIDLDARVKKLEQGGGGAEIDQIEADLTALENTVDGLIEDVSDKITLNSELTFATDDPEISLVRVGKICFLTMKGSITVGASTIGSDTILGTLDESIRPAINTAGFCIGESNSARNCFVGTDGNVKELGGGWFRLQVFWEIATPAPTP